VVELHGNTTYARCIGCGLRVELSQVKLRMQAIGRAPDCADCGQPLKTATLSFGQSMPEEQMRRAGRRPKFHRTFRRKYRKSLR
jgi:NAD-dependent deacetylase